MRLVRVRSTFRPSSTIKQHRERERETERETRERERERERERHTLVRRKESSALRDERLHCAQHLLPLALRKLALVEPRVGKKQQRHSVDLVLVECRSTLAESHSLEPRENVLHRPTHWMKSRHCVSFVKPSNICWSLSEFRGERA